MGFFTSPTSFRLANDGAVSIVGRSAAQVRIFSGFANATEIAIMKKHDSHPPLTHLILLVFEAVMEVVCVSLPGYIVARQGMFDADKQKFVANLNVALFTPCLSTFSSPSCAIVQWLTFDSFHKAGVAVDGR